MLAIEEAGLLRADEKLAPVRVGARVGHGQQAGGRVLDGEVLVGELPAVDRHAARPVAVQEVWRLHQRNWDADMEALPPPCTIKSLITRWKVLFL
jgi:hypothetical protein